MTRTGMARAGLLTLIAVAVGSMAGCGNGSAGGAGEGEDAEFEALQARGASAMGVDQYIAVHQFDALEDGGRIELQHGEDDPEAIETIRAHLKEIQVAFSAGDFSIPAFVHNTPVPGTDVMSLRREAITYTYQELPRGGELRIVTADPEVVEAIRAFMAFQRMDHRSGGMDHGGMDHGSMDHGAGGHDAAAHGAAHSGGAPR
jgi:hypothetical protein